MAENDASAVEPGLDREPRANETRLKDAREPAMWVPPSLLPDPDPVEGLRFRWIREETFGHADKVNVASRLREGWEPRMIRDHPELKLHDGRNDNEPVRIGGLILCAASEEIMSQRDRHYARLAAQQLEAINSDLMKLEDPRMPIIRNVSTRETFGSRG